MPIRVLIGQKLGLVVLEFTGDIPGSEFEARLAPLIDRPDVGLMPLMLMDLMDAEHSDAPSALFRRFARHVSSAVDDKIEGESRVAIAAASDAFYGIGRMYGMLRDQSPVKVSVFRNRPDAERWLGLPVRYQEDLVDLE